MEQQNGEVSKMPEMIMCGDHPSITKAALNTREPKPLDKDKLKDRIQLPSYAKVSPTSSRTERAPSEHRVQRRAPDIGATADRALLEAALGSFRWPPYLIMVWVCVLLLTQLLYGLAALLDRAVPALRNLCHYLREWTEESWRSEGDANHKVCPIALGCATGLMYTTYACTYGVHCLCTWAIDPLRPSLANLPHFPTLPPLPTVSKSAEPLNALKTCLPARPIFLPARDYVVTDYTDDSSGNDKQ